MAGSVWAHVFAHFSPTSHGNRNPAKWMKVHTDLFENPDFQAKPTVPVCSRTPLSPLCDRRCGLFIGSVITWSGRVHPPSKNLSV
ncbi:hypothetical protein BCR44DRAFT_1215624 [Catenaria anguillulae PL171]|uniref:Uncharacterized protein n=1 Tax=Catenaria anguillulae PL171 TaxID=765915 RepID=A0A1Y2I1E5_9FUNG|nr:hypothetical protein BCR44DRAFT_1215624 [Catenaria anguillulae PL171]